MTDPEFSTRRARVESLLESARSLADGSSERGKQARDKLTRSSGLSPAGVELALTRCLEISPSEREIETLIRGTPTAEVAHVLLSANVFVAAHRAIAIASSASEVVRVRPSRREPEMAELLLSGAPGSFQLVSELEPHAGDRLWAYGSDATLDEVQRLLPPGVVCHAHGSGFGVAVIAGVLPDPELGELLPRLAEDIALFDQRGCLSPRVLLIDAEPEYAQHVAQALVRELDAIEVRVPRGVVDPAEAAEISRYRDTANFLGPVFGAGLGFVSVGPSESWLMPPTGRNLHVMSRADARQVLAPVRPMITSCAFAGDQSAAVALRRSLPGARFCQFGHMQTPPFDGPVDRRDS